MLTSLYTLHRLSYSSEKLKTCIEERFEGTDKSELDPSHAKNVLSTKSMGEHTISPPNTTGKARFRLPTTLGESADSQSPSQGEGSVVPERLSYSSDLASGIAKLKEKAAHQIEDPGIRQKVLNSLNKVGDVMSNVVDKGALKVGKKSNGKVSSDNIVEGKRKREVSIRKEPYLLLKS